MPDLGGIGYQAYRNLRISEGILSSEIESSGNERYLIYLGRTHLHDFDTGILSRSSLKIGRGKFATAIMRGRNEGGADFRIYAELIFEFNEATTVNEALISRALRARHVKNTSQGQIEMYNYLDEEVPSLLQTIAELIENQSSYYIQEANLYYSDTDIVPIMFNRNPDKVSGYCQARKSSAASAFSTMFSIYETGESVGL